MTTPTLKILIIDDSAEDRAEMRRMLLSGSETRYRFSEAEMGDEGLRLCREAGDGLPDVVLLDVFLPDMDATEWLEKLRNGADLPPCPVVVITGKDQQSGAKLLHAGAQDFLGKSWTTAESLSRAVENAIERFALLTERARIAGQLREREHFLQRLTDVTPGVLQVFDLADGRCVFINRTVASVIGYSPEEIAALGDNVIPALMHPDDLARFPAHLARVRALRDDEVADFEHRMSDRAGEWHWFHSRDAVFARDEAGEVRQVIGTAIEITERKHTVAELQRVSVLLDTLFKTAPIGFCFIDRDLRYVRINERLAKLNGLPAEAHVGRHISEIVPNLVESVRAVTDRILATGEAVLDQEFNGETTAAPGLERFWQESWYPVRDSAGETLGFGVIVEETTERKQAADALRESHEFTHRVLDNNIAAFVGVTTLDGTVTYANRAPLEAAGIPASEVIGKKFWDCFWWSYSPAIQAQLRKAFAHAASGETVRYDVPVRTAGDTRTWIDFQVAPLRDAGGHVTHLIPSAMDITVRHAAEQKLLASEERMAALNEQLVLSSLRQHELTEVAETANAAKDRFLAMLSHELRTPLTPVLLAVGLIELNPGLSTETREDLAMITRNIKLETKLIDDLLDLNRIHSGKLLLDLAPIDLNEAVRHVCAICQTDLQGLEMRLTIVLDPAAGLVAADNARLQQILWNVLRNAIKFTPKYGDIRIMTTRLAAGRCEVRVQDSGVGIPQEMLPRIFDAFEQGGKSVTQKFGGLGLGLAICKALVELHQGTIRVESPGEGKGATFIIELPVAPSALSATDTLAQTTRAQLSRPIRLLLVEDHADTVRMLTRLLTNAGFIVVSASDVASALAAAERETFDVLISDLGLPDGSGNDVMRALRLRSDLPGIVMSGYGREEDVRWSEEAGFSEHLVKPVDPVKLKEAIFRVTQNCG